MSDPKTFGQAVRGARLARGMSMGQLATSVGRSTASVRRWERDEGVPAKGIIDELVAVLDLSDDDLALIWSEPDHFATPAPLTPAPLAAPPATPLPQSGESQATQAAGSRVVAGVAVAEPEPAGIKGWLAELYDPENPWLGYLRATLTVIVLIILAWILVWALAELFGAVGEIWDGMWAEEV
jgi:transcriptional regulator with XRE-family HTH domain